MSVKIYFKNLLFFLSISFIFLSLYVTAQAQDKQIDPELSVAGIRLGDRASAKKFLADYSAGTDDEGAPLYSFWNKFGNQVMKVTALSFDDPYFITRIEVFFAPQSYLGRHYVLKDQGFFVTENGIFIGYRQSVVSMIAGVPNVGREDRIGPKDIVKKKGEPSSQTQVDKKELIIYDLDKLTLDVAGKRESVKYSALYETNKNKLRRFVIEIFSDKWKTPDSK